MFHSPPPNTDSTVTSARVRLALLVRMRPGRLVVDALSDIDESGLEPSDAVTFLQVVERLTGWLTSRRNAALVAAASPDPLFEEFAVLESDERERTFRIADVVREEVAVALRWTHAAAQREIDAARLLAGPLGDTGAALAAGEISTGHVRVIVEHASRLPGRLQGTPEECATYAEACRAFQARVLPTARRTTMSRTRAQANRVVLSIDAEGVERRRREALCTRDVYVSDQVDGISVLVARMSTEHAHAILNSLDAAARAGQPTSVTLGERRVEALLDAVLAASCPARQPVDEPRLRAHIDLVIDLPTLLTLREFLNDTDNTTSSGGAAHLRGAGAIPVSALHTLLADPEAAVTLRRVICDPITGHLLDYGRRTYAVPDALRSFVVARDGTCRFPGCNRRADRCQIDHAEPWDDDGATSPANLGALCVRHHQLKTHGRWRISGSQADGSCTWTSPHGRTYDHDPGPIHGPPPF